MHDARRARTEKEEGEDYLEKCDANKNGKITCAEARACGLKTPITKDHPAYQYMNDRDGDVRSVNENRSESP